MDEVMRTWRPEDGGPIYAETPLSLVQGQWMLEPWNALSSLLIAAPAIYFLIKLRGRYGSNLLLVLCIPLLITGGLGSALFHGFRASRSLLMLDVMPTMLLFLAVSVFFWVKVFRNWWAAAGVMLIAFAFTWLIFSYFPNPLSVNLGYAVRGMVFFLPLVILLFRTRFQDGWLILGAVGAFSAALVFRLVDRDVASVLPMGSHFLWHGFTGFGGFLVAEYLLRMKRDPGREAASAGARPENHTAQSSFLRQGS
ncbi:MAG: hypothetical protein RLZZ165_2443 [Bacteroidota bacterium]|jgi:hypothetical protein